MRRIVFMASAALLGAAFLVAGCSSQAVSSNANSAAASAASNVESTVLPARPGRSPSLSQIQQRDYWASRVQPAVRLQVMQGVQRHTNWSAAYQVEWEIYCLHALAIREQRNGTAPTTLPALPTTLPTVPNLPVLPPVIPAF